MILRHSKESNTGYVGCMSVTIEEFCSMHSKNETLFGVTTGGSAPSATGPDFVEYVTVPFADVRKAMDYYDVEVRRVDALFVPAKTAKSATSTKKKGNAK